MKLRKLAAIGSTKSGKTTGIMGLSNIPEVGLELTGNDEGRTKIITNYEFVDCSIFSDIALTDIEFNYIDSADERIKACSTILSKLGLSRLLENVENSSDVINDTRGMILNKVFEPRRLGSIINDKALEKYIKSVTVKVPASEYLSQILAEFDTKLVIVDTKGLLDISMEEIETMDKNNRLSMNNLGLDGLSGILWFGSESYPNFVASAYGSFLRSVFQSLPIYIIQKDYSLMDMCNAGYTSCSDYVAASSALKGLVYGDGERALSPTKFLSTLQLFMQIGIAERVDTEKDIIFKESLVSTRYSRMLVPVVNSLKLYSIGLIDNIEDVITADDFKFFTYAMAFNMSRVFESLEEKDRIVKEFIESGAISSFFKLISDPDYVETTQLYVDIDHYGSRKQGETPIWTGPAFKNVGYADLARAIQDKKEHLGVRNGITTRGGQTYTGKPTYYKFFHTIVCGVTAYNWICHCISNYNYDSTDTYISNLFRATVRNLVYERAIDRFATVKYCPLINRNVIVKAINDAQEEIHKGHSVYVEDVILNIINLVGNIFE